MRPTQPALLFDVNRR